MIGGELEMILIQGDELRCVIHNHDSRHEVHFIPDARHEPALSLAIGTLEDCVEGLLIKKWRENLKAAIPENTEDEQLPMVQGCKICGEITSSAEAGSRVHGPFLYCPKHSAV